MSWRPIMLLAGPARLWAFDVGNDHTMAVRVRLMRSTGLLPLVERLVLPLRPLSVHPDMRNPLVEPRLLDPLLDPWLWRAQGFGSIAIPFMDFVYLECPDDTPPLRVLLHFTHPEIGDSLAYFAEPAVTIAMQTDRPVSTTAN